MQKEDFEVLSVGTPGIYRLVPDELLEKMLADLQWVSWLKLPPSGIQALGFTIRYFRERHGLTIQGLAELVGMSRNQLAQIEAAELKRGPHPETLSNLANYLGDEFRAAVEAQGFVVFPGPTSEAS